MSARDRNAARYRLEGGLEFWRERWQLDGTDVVCSACQATQFAREAARPFVHVDGCAQAGDFAQHPRIELRDLLVGLPAVAV
ncbi:hypothetical protein BTW15_27730 [Pseudomonas syringae pv. tomato]|uniref:Uncharacterized protein n=3 Tax=Pseudomonas TaxID=286 RepID=I3W2K7_PSESX|nr:MULTISPECIES: hypothetical protein [Pseudomonas]AFK89834.1 hypothetical protein [Pseudomonas syringae]KPB78027.1 Uncharacterized protein AC505_2126 [Pseudomonas syringae pv. maculicola]MBX6511288.1 hypothetical protein [Pseudomonas syringae pv. tomato]OPE56842.1 hypothetical protein BTW15_27730 [Pseudomonas syringae pv. tomato]TES71905.1 hypothetical protein E2N89_30150 [Pseudomonas syringae pv. tomato]